MRNRQALLGFVLFAACSGGGVPKLPGAVREDIPVFEPSAFEGSDTLAFSTGEDFDSIVNFEAMSWRWSTTRPLAEVLAFYEPIAAHVETPAAETAGDEAAEDDEPAPVDNAAARKPADLPRRVFHLATQPESEVEVAVYMQPRQRLVWFTIKEIVRAAN